jgi:membrane protein involved in colicin uptake
VSNVVSLNKFRKAKAKADAKKRAATNDRLHGRTKAEREAEAKQKAELTRRVDGARLGPAEDDEGEPG